MALDKKSGLALGFGIGAVIALGYFGITWLINRPEVVKTQSLTEPPSSTPVSSPADTTTDNTVVQIPQGEPSEDNLVNVITPTQQEMVDDIGESLKQLYGPSSPLPSASPTASPTSTASPSPSA
ncbi:MAG: hypothetical protein PHF35_05195 [Candidatus Moranbacteria bacterium]|nr:hypothetical protein [Candidatus Moranbacteria bacterium]